MACGDCAGPQVMLLDEDRKLIASLPLKPSSREEYDGGGECPHRRWRIRFHDLTWQNQTNVPLKVGYFIYSWQWMGRAQEVGATIEPGARATFYDLGVLFDEVSELSAEVFFEVHHLLTAEEAS